MLRGRCRLGSYVPPDKYKNKLPFVLAGGNPGGIGHHWVKQSFTDDCEPMTIRRMPKKEGGMLRQYIPAKLSDNPSIDDDYADKLEGLGNEFLVRAMLNGDWDIVAGAYFTEFRREAAYRDWETDRKSTRLNSSHITRSRMPSSA